MNSKLVVFVIACALSVGAIAVFAKNNMNSQKPTDQTGEFTNYSNSVPGEPTPITDKLGGTAQVAGAKDQVESQGQAQVQPQTENSQQSVNQLPAGPITQLMIKDLIVGSGLEVKDGDTVNVNYLGTFLDGKKFDSSYDRGQPFSFTVGEGNVIKGWDQGLVGMKVGGKRQLVIPADLAYGAAGAPGAIPPNTPLVFEIELVAIK